MNLAYASIAELRALLAEKKITPAELLQYTHARFREHDPRIGSALEIFDAASTLAASQTTGSLAGIPGLIKDNICQKNRITSCASRMLASYQAPYDATVIDRLKEQGSLLVGRANMDEFAMGSSTETSAFQKTMNPWDVAKVPGGSGGGSAAAVAAGLVPYALGSDTGGSVRQPAALCGGVGLKPTYGLVSRYGLVAYGSSLDQIGINTRTVADCAEVLSVIAGHDKRDSSSLEQPRTDYTKSLTGSIPSGLRVGICKNMLEAEGVERGVYDAMQEAVREFERMGATISEISLPSLDYSAATYFIISRAEAASNLARFDGVRYGYRSDNAETLQELYQMSRREGFGDNVRLRILVGNYVLSAGYSGDFYINANKARQLMRDQLTEAFKQIDVLLIPSQPAPAFGFNAFKDNALQMDLQDYYTCFANLTGVPALSVPCGFVDNMPIGFQLVGPHLSESLLLQVGHAYQQQTAWHAAKPAGF
jgi:aspartyl-tRNA(Asn)/glutamyl-tRNA(Gln) amidotransferase subunit A